MKKQYSLVFIAWLAVCFIGAIPFYFSGYFNNFTDALFESVSGFTTTGASIIPDIELLPNKFLLWRAITQWLGGLGALLTFAMLPVYSTGGFQLKKIEAVDSSGQEILLRSRSFIFSSIIIYIFFTALQFFLLLIFGMDWFSALTQSFSTISTGGFSIKNNGINFNNSASIEWIQIIFMFLAGINIFLIWLFFIGRISNVFKNSEARTYAVVILVSSVIVAVSIFPQSYSFGTTVRRSLFNVVSIISTTGFLRGDITSWASAAQGVLFFLLFLGGCSFSAAGGVKIIRYLLIGKQTLNEMKRLVYPRGVNIIMLDGRIANKRAVHGAAGFIFLYFLILAAAALLVSSGGTELFTSVITAAVCQGNIGLGTYIPFYTFPNYVKWGLCFVMIIGRLELWTALIIFRLSFWRR